MTKTTIRRTKPLLFSHNYSKIYFLAELLSEDSKNLKLVRFIEEPRSSKSVT